MPSLCASADSDALADEDEDRSDRALAPADQLDNFLAVLDQAAMLTIGFGGYVGCGQLINRGQAGQFDDIVFVGFAFDVFKQPSIFVRAADDYFKAQLAAQVAHPTARSASFYHHKVRAVRFKQRFKEAPVGG